MTARSKKASAKKITTPAKTSKEKKSIKKSSKAEKPITALLLIQKQLIKDGKALSQKHIGKMLGKGSSGFNLMVNAKRGISYEILKGFYEKFNININFIISGGKGDIYRSELEGLILEEGENPQQYMTNHKILEIEVRKLKDQLQDKETIIQLMKSAREKEAEKEIK
jgi:hypothetical protein